MKVKSFLILVAALLSMGSLTACSKDSTSSSRPFSGFWFWQGDSEQDDNQDQRSQNALQVLTTEGQPVAGAQILIGKFLPNEIISELIITDQNGAWTAPEAWTNPEMVTISAPGYVRATYLNQLPQGQTFQVKRSVSEQRFELKGNTSGFKVVNKDDVLDFGLILPAFTRTELFGFDLSMIFSPEMDTVDARGEKLSVPSNLALPKQKETYWGFTVELNKPSYRIYFNTNGDKMIYALRGQAPFKKLVKDLRDGKSFFDMLNMFKLQGGAIREVALNTPSTPLDIPVNELNFNKTVAYQAPIINKNESLMVVAASDYKGRMLPTDVKRINSGAKINLTSAEGSEPTILSILKDRNSNDLNGPLSVSMMPVNENTTLIPLMRQPQVLSPYELAISSVNAPSEIRPLATHAALMKVQKVRSGETVYEVTERTWEVFSESWLDGFSLPQWPTESKLQGTNRWEVTLIGRKDDLGIALGPDLLETATHATRSSTDF